MKTSAVRAAALAALREEQGAWACIYAGAAATAVMLVVLARVWSQLHLWQAVVPLSGNTAGVICMLLAHSRLRHHRVDAAWSFLSTGAIMTYASLELAFSGLGVSVAMGGLLTFLRILGVEQRAAAGRGAFGAVAFALFIIVVNELSSLPRIDAATVPPLALTVHGLTAALGLGVLWHYLQSFRKAHTLRVRMLVAFLLMVALTAGPIVTASAVLTYYSTRDRVLAQLESVAALKEAEICAWVEDRGADVRLVVAAEAEPLRAALLDPQAEDARAHLHANFRLHVADRSHFDELFLMDARGRIVLSSNSRSEGEFRGLQEYFREGRERPGMFVQTLSFSSTSERVNTIIAVQPVFGANGALIGVMGARASLQKLNEIMLERAGLGDTGETYLVGNNHVLLTGARFPGYRVGETYLSSEAVLGALYDHQSGRGLYADYRRVPVLGVYRWLPSLRVALVGELDQAEAFRPARLVMTVSIQVAAAAMLSAAFASLLFTRSIAGPVTSLAETAARIAAGERSLVATVERRDEIGALAEAFNHMTSDLQGNLDALRRERDLLARVMATSPAGITVIDRSGQITFANARAEEVLGLVRSESVGRAYDDPAWRITDFEGRPMPPEELPFAQVLATRQAVVGFRHAIEWPDGRRVLLSITAAPLVDAKGEFDGMVAAVEDVTDRMRAELELRQAHDELEVRVTERTRQLEAAQRDLVDAARRAGRAEIATNVLHNVGNVLNSVNTSASLLAERIRASRGQLLGQVSQMLEEHRGDLGAFFTTDPKGRQVPKLIEHLARNLAEERARHQEDIESLVKNVAHIKTIVQLQQSYAGASSVMELTSLAELIEDAVRIVTATPFPAPIHIVREIEDVPPMSAEKHKILQIVINLISNAKHAVIAAPSPDKQITLRLRKSGARSVLIEVQDNGVGIAAENLTRIFQHGFTTRREGHGFGLHSGTLAAHELRGSLTARSEGEGKGAIFVLELPMPDT